MIPVPQPRHTSAQPEQAASPTPPGAWPPGGGRRPPRRLFIVLIVVGAVVLAGAATGVALLLGSGIDLVLIGLIAAFLVSGVIGFALRLFPDSLPLVPFARSILGLLSIAALGGLLYLYVYPAVTNVGRGSPPPGSSTSLTKQVTVVYTLTGDGGAEITSASPLPAGDTAPTSVDQLPWEKTAQVTVNKKVSGIFTLVATGTTIGDDAQLACTITVDGVVVAHEESAGDHRLVFCSGTLE